MIFTVLALMVVWGDFHDKKLCISILFGVVSSLSVWPDNCMLVYMYILFDHYDFIVLSNASLYL